MRHWLLHLTRKQKRILQVLTDLVLLLLSVWLAFVVRVGAGSANDYLMENLWLLWAAPLISFPIFTRLGMYRAVLRYMGLDSIKAITKAITWSAIVLALVIYLKGGSADHIPRSYVFNYWIINLILIGGLRILIRDYFRGELLKNTAPFLFLPRKSNKQAVVIYGAGASGNQLLHALRSGKTMEPVAFLDDDPNISNRVIAGLKVYKPKHIERMIKETGATQLLLAMPSASRARRREILAKLEPYPLHVRTIPGFMDLVSGKVKVQDLQEVDIADLLGRDAVEPDAELFARCIKQQVVMVTGAGGSIGSELCRQIINSQPKALILYEHAEYNLYSIHRELEKYLHSHQLEIELLPILGSIREPERMLEVMQYWQVNTVYHAAAYKHVPIVEYNSAEGVDNNVFGTLNTAEAAILAGVENFVLISTDKAVRPTNIMGGTKRFAELVLQALSHEPQVALKSFAQHPAASPRVTNNTRFTMVRFGNVLGSSGSVIPLFRQQIANGGPVTVTHPNITRYFMTIPEAAQLVIQAGSMGQGGDVFVLDMGEPVRIAELAEKMINLTGLTVKSKATPSGEIEIQYTGLRPGEKLYEELLIGDNVESTGHPMIMSANESYLPWEQLCPVLSQLADASAAGDCQQIRQILRAHVDGFAPQSEIVDLIYRQKQTG
ncbi:polysaccharide biosynthesis protein [Thiopseudomonas alkaliphila]|uniref:polysaccharide biosynthesis protein n=1 Tax=Thiopseudomonas alkaliphila TaxID=1697053 RepID=UPI002576DCEE|nr:nucleoside-diphosphate sugar epimerase/dehydratase [Thiopseudomonas alkaliphila]MDM1707285.1 polysaccharide biosynthesis protein [Thiopseudomonas alkaliphila]